jgi:hypothetical protein
VGALLPAGLHDQLWLAGCGAATVFAQESHKPFTPAPRAKKPEDRALRPSRQESSYQKPKGRRESLQQVGRRHTSFLAQTQDDSFLGAGA